MSAWIDRQKTIDAIKNDTELWLFEVDGMLSEDELVAKAVRAAKSKAIYTITRQPVLSPKMDREKLMIIRAFLSDMATWITDDLREALEEAIRRLTDDVPGDH